MLATGAWLTGSTSSDTLTECATAVEVSPKSSVATALITWLPCVACQLAE